MTKGRFESHLTLQKKRKHVNLDFINYHMSDLSSIKWPHKARTISCRRIGALPVFMPKQKEKFQFSFVQNADFQDDQAISIIKRFISKLWSGSREPAHLYIQESRLPTILSLVKDGTYSEAMINRDKMNDLVELLSYKFDNAGNMDWF